MKIQYWCSIGLGPATTKTFDTEKDFGLTDEEWNDMDDEDKEESLHDWACEQINYGIKEV